MQFRCFVLRSLKNFEWDLLWNALHVVATDYLHFRGEQTLINVSKSTAFVLVEKLKSRKNARLRKIRMKGNSSCAFFGKFVKFLDTKNCRERLFQVID